MKAKTFCGMIVAGLLCLAACSSGGGGGNGGAAVETYTEDPTIFAKAPEASALETVATADGDLIVPVNLIVFVFDDTVTRDGAEALIEAQGGVLTGQIPDLGIYQAEFAGLASLAELDAKLAEIEAQAISGLVAVSYDAFSEPLEAGVPDEEFDRETTPTLDNCQVFDDNMWLGPRNRCPLENAEYFQLIAIMNELKDEIAFHTVRVGVMDTGLQQNYGEFDDITVINIDAPGTPATDPDTGIHGTKVAGIIAADDDGQGMNGIASKVLGRKLVLGATEFRTKTAAQELATLAQMAANGFSVVNMSFGYRSIKFTPERYAALRAAYKQGISRLPGVLFVTAADNYPYELDRTNDCPAGIDLPNMLTVGGLEACDVDQPFGSTSYGPLVELAAPAVRVICPSTLGLPKIAASVGNSFAAPQATAVAAIMKSIDPDLTPFEIKTYLRENALPTIAHVGGLRLVYTLPVLQLLVDSDDTPEAVLDLLDLDGDDTADPAGIIVNRICGGIEYRVSSDWGFPVDGTYRVDGEADENPGALMSDGALVNWSFGAMADETPPLLTLSCTGCDFAIFGHSYAVDNSGNNVTLGFVGDEEEGHFVAGVSGSVIFDNCQVLQRWGIEDLGMGLPDIGILGNDPAMVAVEGRFQITGRTQVDMDFLPVSIDGTFVMPLALPLGNAGPELIEYIETNCLCGTGVSE
jgi:subtilisin family serine protease